MMSVCLLSSVAPVKRSPKLALGEPAIGERFPIQQDARRKKNAMAQRQRLSLRRVQVEQVKGKCIFPLQTFEDLFSLRTKSARFLGEQQNTHFISRLSLEPSLDIREQIGNRHIHGIVR